MLNYFIESLIGNKKWILKPKKYSKDAKENYSSKVLLPHYMLQELNDYNFKLPYIFELFNQDESISTACSVLDFALETDEVHIPSWMYEQLGLENNDTVVLKYLSTKKGNGIKLLPHSTDFLEVENPREELEKGLFDYHVVSYGDEILLSFEYFGNMRFTVTNVVPEEVDTIYLVDTDLNVDFDEPIGYAKKLEDEKTVRKYMEIEKKEDDVRIFRMKKIGFFTDWDSFDE